MLLRSGGISTVKQLLKSRLRRSNILVFVTEVAVAVQINIRTFANPGLKGHFFDTASTV